MLTNILVPVDGSEDSWSALAQAIEIAKEENSIIHGLFVADARLVEAPNFMGLPVSDPTTIERGREAGRRLSKRGHDLLTELTKRCQQSNVICQQEYAEGIVSQTIIDRAQQTDLVVMGRHGDGVRWAGPKFGSIFEAVVRHANAPVLTAQNEVREIKRILLAYDGSKKAQHALEIARELVKGNKNRQLFMLTVDDGHRYRLQQYERGCAALRGSLTSGHTLFRKGHVTEEILNTARNENCDLIVMGAYGHTHFINMLLGSTAYKVIQGTICPLILCQ